MKFSTAIFLLSILGAAFTIPTIGKVSRDPKRCNYSHNFLKAGDQAYLRSPNWPNNYSHNSDCRYNLSSPLGTEIKMECTEVNIEYTKDCAYDRMTISLSGDPKLQDGMSVCGQGSFTRTTSANKLALSFKSDGSNALSRNLYRFQCLLSVIDGVSQTTPKPGFSNTTCTCGIANDAARIVGGVQALPNEFPWRVALYSPNLGVFCGATIISPNWVLTAAHCTNSLNGAPLYADVGDYDLANSNDSENELVKCDKVIQHSLYDNKTQDNDISLCHLETPLKYSRNIQPACLPWTMSEETFQGKTVVASGWGTTSYAGAASPTLMKVELPVVTTEECRGYFHGAITDNMICTYLQGKDTCQGDSGGSIDLKNTDGRYYAIGVVSWGVGCAGVNQPGVYSKITRYLNWIESTTSGESFCR